jgi:hypothetical protein
MNADILGPQRVGLLQHRAWDFWFAPKRFESPQLYERLGILWIKRYVPTGGDYFRKKYGVRVIDIKSTIESLLKFEERTRLYEAIHLGAFLAFLLFSIWQLVSGRTTGMGLSSPVRCTCCSFFRQCCCNAITAFVSTRRYVA